MTEGQGYHDGLPLPQLNAIYSYRNDPAYSYDLLICCGILARIKLTLHRKHKATQFLHYFYQIQFYTFNQMKHL